MYLLEEFEFGNLPHAIFSFVGVIELRNFVEMVRWSRRLLLSLRVKKKHSYYYQPVRMKLNVEEKRKWGLFYLWHFALAVLYYIRLGHCFLFVVPSHHYVCCNKCLILFLDVICCNLQLERVIFALKSL